MLRTPHAMAAWLALTLGASSGRADDIDPHALARQARDILKTHCYRCHGHDGANEGGFNYVADLKQLVARRKVVPGQPAKSKLLRRLQDADDPMPPPEEKKRPTADEIALLQRWVEAGAPADDTTPARAVVTLAEMFRLLRADLDRARPRDRPFLRFFSLTHLHNAGLSAEEMQSYRHGLAKLINSLSWGRRVLVPTPIDPARTVFRIDLRDYQWDEKTWDALVSRYPYGQLPDADDVRACAAATRCALPCLRADWFVATASKPPLYHDVLQLPATEPELERLLRVNVSEDIRQERVARAGFNGSGVSRNNRLLQRHESGSTVYWRSYDFAANTGRQNLFSHPLGPGDGESDFQADGGEIIFTLPNGLFAYFLTDGQGRRLDKGPTAIVSDPRRPDRAVENGLSCMSCHARGIIEKADQVRPHVLKNADAFARGVVDLVQALYPTTDAMTALMRADAKRFQEAVARTGAPLTTTEPISALAARFEADLDLPLAAAEASVTPRELLAALDRVPALAKQLGPLRVEGSTVQRQVFVDCFQELTDALALGKALLPRDLAIDRLVRQGQGLLPGDPAGALQAFEQALAQQPDLALAHAGRGDVCRLRGDFEEALAAYDRALRLEPRSAVVLNNRGLVRQRLGKLEQAVEDFDAALRLEPRFVVGYYNRGAAQQARGELERAIADYTEALQLDPKFARAYSNRGVALLEKREFAGALADLDEAIRLDPDFAAARNNRGLVHLRQGRLEPAIADFSAAIRLEPRFARAYFNRAAALERQGDKRRAETDRKRAVELDPSLGSE
jgi:tetratricopeptide (TPR) repeat protein